MYNGKVRLVGTNLVGEIVAEWDEGGFFHYQVKWDGAENADPQHYDVRQLERADKTQWRLSRLYTPRSRHDIEGERYEIYLMGFHHDRKKMSVERRRR